MILNPEHNPQLATILVDIDAIFDTRAGTIAKISKDKMTAALRGDYFSRKSDHFSDVDSQEFFKLYRERDIVTLSLSMITHVVTLLKDFVARVNITSESAPIKKVPKIDINIHPYKIPESVISMIIKALKVTIDDNVDVDWVDYPPEDLHYDLLKHTYDHAIMYSVGPLIEAQAEDWEKRNKGIPELTVFTPLLCHSENKAEVPDDMLMAAEEVEKMLSPVLNVMQLPIQFFCLVIDPRMFTRPDAPEGAPGLNEVSEK